MEVPAGLVNFRGSLRRSENNVLQPMLHPELPRISTGRPKMYWFLYTAVLNSF